MLTLIYIGTPHSHHYDVAREAIEAGKPCLIEKAFMANSRQAEAIINLAHERGVFVAEAIWTRYQPAVGIVRNLIIDNINNPQTITVNGHDRTYVETIHMPQQITGYEYQFMACRQALIDGLKEPVEMPHAETLYIMQLMDGLRREWGVRYPMD